MGGAQSLLQGAGAQPDEKPKWVPIHVAAATAGLITNRVALHDPSIGIYSRFYGGQPDVLLSGSNIEISPQQTYKHRPGTSAYTTLSGQCLTTYPFYNTDGTVSLYLDTATGVYILDPPASAILIYTKSAGAGQTSFLQIGDILYFADGVDNKKVIGGIVYNWASDGPATQPTVVVDSVGGGGQASVPWTAATVVTTMGLLKDPNGNIQQLNSVNADGSNTTSTVFGSSGVGEPIWNNTSGGTVAETSITWTCYGPVALWVAGQQYTDASTVGTSSAPAFIYDLTSGNIFIFNANGAGTGHAGSVKPNFSAVPLLGHVSDNGFKWFNVGTPDQWAPSHTYAQWGANGGAGDANGFIIEPSTPKAAGYGTPSQKTVFAQACTTTGGGSSNSTHTGPQWATSSANPTTRDGQLGYTFLSSGTHTTSHTYVAFQVGSASFSVIFDGTNLQVCIAGGVSAGTAPTWLTGYGQITNDGASVQWVCVGKPIAWAASTQWMLPASGFTPPVAATNPYGGCSILDTNGNIEFVTNNGKTQASHPTWPTTIGATVTESGGPTWTLTALASTFKGSTPLAFSKGYAYTYAWKARTANDFYVTNAPNGQPNALGIPVGSATGGITTAAPVYQMPVGNNAGAVMQVSGTWPTDLQYDTVVVYRCADGAQTGPYLELTEIACPTPVNGVYQGSGWSFYDSVPDNELNELIEADVIGLNTPPPAGITNLELHMNRIWGNVVNAVFCSSGPDIPPDNGNGYEGWAPANIFPLQSPVNKHIATQSGLLCFTTSDVFIIAGGPAVSNFFPWRIAKGIGLMTPNAIQTVGGEIYMFTSDSRFIAFQPGVGHTEPGFLIADQLATFTPANVYVTEHAVGTDPSAFYVGDGSVGWFRLVPHATPGFVSADQPVWSPQAVITGGCTMVQSVIAPTSGNPDGLRTLLVGQVTGTVLKRDLTTAQDNGSNFAGNFVIGSIVIAHPSQLAELGFVEMDFAKVGNPTVGFIVNEILGGSGGAAWNMFTTFSYDPPIVYQATGVPTTYSPRRYNFKQTVNTNQNPPPLYARHIQLLVNFPAENFFHELFTFTVAGRMKGEK